ncbi:MAG: 50S ribosomal protein L6, partial [Anaerolineae bacterium]
MSRVGLKAIPLPEKVNVDIRGNKVTVKGPKGQLDRTFHPDMEI